MKCSLFIGLGTSVSSRRAFHREHEGVSSLTVFWFIQDSDEDGLQHDFEVFHGMNVNDLYDEAQ